MWDMWEMRDGWGWWMAFGWVWMLVFWGLIIWAVYTVVTRLGGGGASRPPGPTEASALEILERRYARGELSTAEFEEMRERLTRAYAGDGVGQGGYP